MSARIERPPHPTAVAATVARSPGVLARGLGRSYGDAAQLEGGTLLDTRALTAIGPVDAPAGRIDIGAGVSIGELMRRLAPQGWMLPVAPGTRHVTVGGAIAADIHGKNHHRDGSFGRYVESITLVLADSSSRVVTREDDRRVFEATLGGMGLTGVVTSARLQLAALPSNYVHVRTEKARDLDALMASLVEGDASARYSVAWLDLASPRRRGRGIAQFGNLVGPEALPAKRGAEPLAYGRESRLVAPSFAGRRVVRGRGGRAFNTAYWRLPRRGERFQRLAPFLHPLDAVRGWNRLYGRYGFLQYQFVVPDGAEDALRRIAMRLAASPVPPALAVLKRFGAAGEGMLSFPLAGWTLAVDLPAEDARVFLLLDQLDEEVARAGGRVYLAKDARLRPDLLGAMYPRLDEWRALRAELDPDGRFRSDLATRLGLT